MPQANAVLQTSVNNSHQPDFNLGIRRICYCPKFAEGTSVYAPAPGIILETGNYFFNGNTIILDHGHGLISLYCHMNTIDVTPGTVVNTGDQIGRVGQTGRDG
ncbi:MAG: M23 family metallopeptidase [Gammaproteobacteria bacterium]|nr:M23 family metallopeptidase [Gammaproteobacteria bacterium]HJO11771.1 M23 family metallopeptidase [Gammaproteobacteria bacterium]